MFDASLELPTCLHLINLMDQSVQAGGIVSQEKTMRATNDNLYL